MSRLPPDEREALVSLLRRISPHSLPLERPRLDHSLSACVSRTLPRRPRAIFFDIYGTLLASAAGGEPAFGGEASGGGGTAAVALLEERLAAQGWQTGAVAFSEGLARLVEERRRTALASVPFPEVDIEELVADLLQGATAEEVRSVAVLLEAANNPCAPMPGAQALLGRMAESTIRLGIVSNAQFYTPLLIEALLGRSPEGLGFEEDLIAWSFELGVAKPARGPYERASATLFAEGVEPGEILMIGNSSSNDIAPAKGLGLMTALFAGDARSFRPTGPGSPGARPDTVLLSLDELDAVLPSRP